MTAPWPDHLLTAATTVTPCATVAEWWPRHRALCAERSDSIDQAIVGGYIADRVAWAFATAYQSALRALVPSLPQSALTALCVTEEGGTSPKAMRSELNVDADGVLVLNGAKRWTTLGPDGGLFLVAARDARVAGDKPALRLVRVDARAIGVHIESMPPTSFVPEVAHARLRFENVSIAEHALLPGDGYARYVKPFRTIEDLHVHAAILAYLVREARRLGWPRAWIERALAVLAAYSDIAQRDPASSATHVVLAGALASGEQLAHETDAFWDASSAKDPEAAVRWKRDKALLKIASQARAARLERAWERHP
jgi:acyl-CoA dehydrogenase